MNQPHVALLNADAARGAWKPDLPRLEELRMAADMTQTDYAESWAWIHMLLETIPQRRELLHAYLKAMTHGQPNEPLSAVLRRSSSQPDEDLRAHLRSLAAKA